MYFKSLRKVQIFGVRIDCTPKQLNFLVDEDETIGLDGTFSHGPNAIISMLDHVLNTYGRNERSISLHADNCPGQNKNRYMIGYLQWRILTGKNDTIEYQMQIPGHAKCLVDSGFGHLKKLYRRSNTETLDQLRDVVEKSSEVNSAVRYPEWKWMDWKKFLEPVFKPIPGIRKYQYFRMAIEEPGMVTVRTGADEPQTVIDIRKQNFVLPSYTPDVMRAEGLSRQRQEYLVLTSFPTKNKHLLAFGKTCGLLLRFDVIHSVFIQSNI